MQDSIGVREFLSAVWGDREGVAELTYISDKTISFGFTYPKSLDAVLTSAKNHNGKTNCYFGVCLRKPETRIGYFDGNGHRGKEVDALSSTCVWADIDFKVVQEDHARKLLKEFPLKPSIVVKSGGGIHVYWLFKEAVDGEDLRRVKAVNKALHAALKCDRQTVDLARVLRVPDTLNMKYTPPRPCEISWWKPEVRYSLDDFEKILAVDEEKTEDHGKQPAHVQIDLPDDVRQKIEPLLKELWIEGWRHRMALYVAGVFAHAGFSETAAKAVITNVSNAADGDTDKRLKDVEDTYKNFTEQKKVGGAGLLEKMVREEFPPLVSGNATKIYNEVLRHIKKASPKKGRSNFHIEKVLKFDSRPAKYRIIIRMDDGTQVNVDTPNTDSYLNFRIFKLLAFEQANQLLASKSVNWETMISNATESMEIRPAPEEASPSGAFMLTLTEFIEDKREDADQGMLKAFPGYDEKEIYFRFSALRATIRERGLKIDEPDIYQLLRAHGWASSVRRFGEKTSRVWSKPYENGTGHLKPQPKIDPQLELQLPSVKNETSNDF